MASVWHRFAIFAALSLTALLVTRVLHAETPETSAAADPSASRSAIGSAERVLLDAANRDRQAHGLKPLQWDSALASAARAHAQHMAQRNTLSHQFPGEAPMQDRARQAGARFSLVAENVAQGPTATGIHTQWMNSPPHRENLLDPGLNSIGIAVVRSGSTLFAVEDFSNAVPSMSLGEQEHQVGSQLAARGLPVSITSGARKACNREPGNSDVKPQMVLRYEVSDLSRLPNEVVQKLENGTFKSAAVGACEPRNSSEFAAFRIAILLF